MAQFDVSVERNGAIYDMVIDAENEAEAELLAMHEISGPKYMSDEERKQKIARLEEEQKGYEGGSLFSEVVMPTVVQSATAIGSVPAQIGSALADAGAALGIPGAEDAAAFMQRQKEELKEAGHRAAEKGFEQAWGRAPTEGEAQSMRESSEQAMWNGEIIAEVATSFLPAGIAARATTLPRALALGVGEGAGTAFLLTDSDAEYAAERTAERLKGASVGAVFGGVVNGAFVGIPAAFKNSFARYVDDAIEAAGGRAAYARAAEDVGGMLTIGQWTGNPKILLAEQKAAGDLAQNAVVRQKDALIRNASSRLGYDLPDIKNLTGGHRERLDKYVKAVKNVFLKEHSDINTAFRNTMNSASKVHQGPVLKLDDADFGQELFRIIKEAHSSYGTKAINPKIKQMLYDIAKAGKEGATPAQLHQWLEVINAMRNANGAGMYVTEGMTPAAIEKLHALGMSHLGVLKNGINKAIEQAAPQGGTAGQAIAMLKQARRAYGNRKNALASAQAELIGSLGLEGSTAIEVIQRMSRQDTDQLAKAVDLLKGFEGGLEAISSLKDAIIHGSAQAAASGTAKQQGAKLGGFHLGDFLDAFAANSERAVASTLITPQQARYANEALDHARRIMNSTIADNGVVLTHAGLDLSNVAINFVSRDPGFIARLVGGTIERGAGAEKLFFTPEGVQVLKSLREVAVGGNYSKSALAASNAATVWLIDMLGEAAYNETVE